MANEDNQLVLAFFDNEAAARKAAEDLELWDKANDAVKAGAVGVIVEEEDTQRASYWIDRLTRGLPARSLAPRK